MTSAVKQGVGSFERKQEMGNKSQAYSIVATCLSYCHDAEIGGECAFKENETTTFG